jgi:glucokinase
MSAPGDDSRRVAVGIDLGGTGTRVVALDTDGVIRREQTASTATGLSTVHAVADLIETVAGMVADLDLQGVGIGASGPVDCDGVIRNPSTLRAFSDIPLATIIADRLAVPCVIDNDAVTAAIGEHRYGAGRNSDALLVVTLGTGIGVCMLSCGRPVRAADGSHPEAGHISVSGPAAPCYCGLASCWEQVASRTTLNHLAGGRAEEIAQSARNGDPAGTDLFGQYGERVGVGLATLLTLYRPDRVVIGGGAAQYLDLFQAGMRHRLTRSSEYSAAPEILAAEIGNVAGAVGAAVLSMDISRSRPVPRAGSQTRTPHRTVLQQDSATTRRCRN